MQQLHADSHTFEKHDVHDYFHIKRADWDFQADTWFVKQIQIKITIAIMPKPENHYVFYFLVVIGIFSACLTQTNILCKHSCFMLLYVRYNEDVH